MQTKMKVKPALRSGIDPESPAIKVWNGAEFQLVNCGILPWESVTKSEIQVTWDVSSFVFAIHFHTQTLKVKQHAVFSLPSLLVCTGNGRSLRCKRSRTKSLSYIHIPHSGVRKLEREQKLDRPFVREYLLRRLVREFSIRVNTSRSIHQGWGRRFPCNDRTDEVKKSFIIWPFSAEIKKKTGSFFLYPFARARGHSRSCSLK